MKLYDVSAGFQTLVSNEEHDLIQKIAQTGHMLRREMTEREQQVARSLINKMVLTRSHMDNKLVYHLCSAQDNWRIRS